MTKFRRIKDRPGDHPELYWKAGYEFEGKAYPEYDQIEELTDKGSFQRIHTLSSCEEVRNDQ